LVTEGDRTQRKDKAQFPTTTKGLATLGDWLQSHEVRLVAMEATGVYWKAPYYALEDRFELWLCNAHHVKNVPGRKTDVADSEWLADVAAHGMVRPSFVPPPPIRELRELTRYRKTQVNSRGQEIQRLEKLLQDAGIKLTSVASKVLTVSGRDMVEALIGGERDPVLLADLARRRMRSKIPALQEALLGHFGAHHATVASRILSHIDLLDVSISALSQDIDERTQPYRSAYELLLPVPGLGRLVIDTIVAETGADMSAFPTSGHLASWAGLSPGNHESAGRRRRTKTRPGNQWLQVAMTEAARAAARTKDTYFTAHYRRIARRRGPNRAATAVAHSLLVIVWHILSTGEVYTDLGADYYEKRRNPELKTARLVHELEKLGFDVTLDKAS
jgi:transposase